MTGITMQSIPLEDIHESETNPRSRTKVGLEDLIESVKAHGVLQPVLLRMLSPSPSTRGYELVAGHRRVAAARAAGLTEVPATIREMTAEQALELQLIENLHRADLHPLEEAQGYHQLSRLPGYDVARISERVGRSIAYVYDRLKLLSLTKPAQKLFLEGRFAAGHAVLLARLKPEDQTRALDPKQRAALFIDERGLFDPDETEDPKDGSPLDGMKACTVKELQGWIDEHVRFAPAAKDVPQLFPETAATVKAAAAAAEKVVHITHEHYVQESARSEERIIGPRSWKPAEKPCEKAVTGVIVVGPGRGRALRVCIDKSCKIHWAAEHREKTKRANAVSREGGTGEERARLEAQKRKEAEARGELERKRWVKARAAIVKGLAEFIESQPAVLGSGLGKIVLGVYSRGLYGVPKSVLEAAPAGKTAEGLIRRCAYLEILDDLWTEWRGPETARELKKSLGFDAFKILNEIAPEPKAEKTSNSGSGKTGRSAKPAAKRGTAKGKKVGARARRRAKKAAKS